MEEEKNENKKVKRDKKYDISRVIIKVTAIIMVIMMVVSGGMGAVYYILH